MIRRSQSPLRKSSSHAVQSNGDLDSLRKLYNSLSASLLSKGDNTDEVVKQLQIFPGYLTDVVSNNKFSSTDLIFISQTFEKVADFLGTDKASNVQGRLKATLSPQWNRLNQFFTKLTDEAVKQFGADIWLALSKLLLSSSEFKLLSNEWDEVFLPMEHWFSAMDGEAAEICLRKWNAFVSFVGSKLDGRSKRSKLIPMFCKPLRSRTLINKLNSPEPIIEGYTTLIKSFKDLLDEHFDELVICFLRFLSGRSAAIFNSTEEIEKELNKPIDSKSSKLVLNCAYPSHLEYIADDRLYQASDRASTHLLPVICAILGVDCNGSSTDIPACGENPLQTQKYAIFFGQMVRLAGNLPDAKGKSSIISSCFAALAQRIGCIEEIAVKRSESRLLFVQIRTWISENNFNLEELESALSVLFTPTDHSIHANTVGEWPAKNILSAVLDKCADGKISSLLEIVCGTLRDAPENPDTILGRVDELSTLISEHVERFEVRTLLKTWAQLADIMKNHIRETDDINQGNLTCPDFSTTFGLLRLIFKIANCADEDFDTAMVQKCCSLFGQLYAEAQNTVRREYRCSAGTILSGVLGQLISPKTSCCVNFYVSAFTSILDVYPFSLLNESEVFSGPSLEFNPLGEIAPFVDALKVIQKALTELTTSAEGKLPRTAPENCLSIVVICQKLLDSLEKPNMIRNMFLTLSDLLKDMYDMFFGDDIRFKDVSRGALDAYLVILDLVKKKISGPYDDILLSGCAPLMAQLLGGIGGRRSKLRVAAAELWNVTFAKAKSLTYPKELRKILTTLVQKRVVYAPGLSRKSLSSTDLNEYKEITVVESPSKSAEDSSSGRQHGRRSRISRQPSDAEISTSSVPVSTSRSARRQAKRSFSPVDSQADNTVASKRKAVSEDEIPPSPVVKVEEEPEKQNQKSQNPKFKKNQLTPVRYATAGTKRRNYVSLLDEDSVDYVPIPSTDSAKKMKLTDRQKEIFSEKRERMPFLDEDSQSIAVITNLQTEFDLESSQSASLNNNVPVPVAVKEEPVIENGDADEPMETVALASEDAKGFFVDTAADSNNSDDAAVKRRSKIKLNFDKVETTAASSRNSGSSLDVDVNRVVSDSVKKVDGPASHIQIIEPNLESEDSVESSGEASAELSGDSDVEQIKQMEKPPRSRRTQKKGTPTKYVAKKRRSIVKNTEKEKTRRQSRTSTVNVEVVEVAKIAADVEGSKEVIKDKNAVESEEMQPLPEIEDVLTNQGSRDLDGKSRESGNAMTSEKNSEDAEKVATAMTPSLVQRLGGTPGILKKVNSPSTAEKKLRRVHFDNNFENNAADSASTIIEEADKVSTIDEQFPASPKGTLKVITPRRPFAHVQPAEEKTATTTSLEKDDPSPVKIEGDSEDLPIFADLMECQESIAKIVGKLVPVSTNTGSITLRKTLEARGIVQIRHLASMSRREIAALNIKRPRVETTLKALTQFARDYVPPANKPLFKAASVPETETAAVPSEEPPAVLPEGIVEEENAVIENAHPDGEDKLEEIVATGDVAEAATVSPTKEAAEPAEMLNSEECSVEQPQPDPSLVYAEKLRQWKETVLEANRQFELAMQAAEESGLSPGEIRSKRGLLMMVNGCVEMIAAPYSSR